METGTRETVVRALSIGMARAGRACDVHALWYGSCLGVDIESLDLDTLMDAGKETGNLGNRISVGGNKVAGILLQ